MQLLHATLYDQPLSLEIRDNQQYLSYSGKVVSTSSHEELTEHHFVAANGVRVALQLTMLAGTPKMRYQLSLDGEEVQSEEFLLPSEPTSKGTIGLLALGFKLFKSAKVVKAALAAASVAGYSWLFSIEFALVLVACLVVHEYGHVRAMQYFGIKTKGIYLIPFVGGLALSDDKLTTRWQDVVISIMGPVFGLLMSLGCLLLYALTGQELFAGAAVIGSLLNLFNLLPILPLDGGHVIKSISFSMRSWLGLSVCIAGMALGLGIAWIFGLALLVFFIFFGAIEILLEWRTRHQSVLVPLDSYGRIFSALWYILTLAGHVAVIYAFADAEHPILQLPMQILAN
ncbi:site-2 protease family protein [Bowmanella yangjiangensis]|uniref:Site-2 protease family protein n=1 Tax=Bowmanella yangjiangensis TaxID=2811230 RepID=A0ABS3CSF1_9ALTE|nr:site-2 protease family protein [Bowmanella yangjiangensis]MBN7819980.1 site-2 protease family protein [Bowmanella yangjiangensis]